MWRHQELATSGFNTKAPPLHAQPGTLEKHPHVAKSILDKEVAAVSDRVKVAPPQLILPPPPQLIATATLVDLATATCSDGWRDNGRRGGHVKMSEQSAKCKLSGKILFMVE